MCTLYFITSIMDLCVMNSHQVLKAKIKRSNDSFDWKFSHVKELLLCHECALDCGLTSNEISNILGDVCIN